VVEGIIKNIVWEKGMPLLEIGGKKIFGWCIINEQMQIQIPAAAYEAYAFQENETVLLIKGSNKSGGFGIARQPVAAAMPFFARIFTQSTITENGIIHLPKILACQPGDKLLALQNSPTALSFIQHGSIYEQAQKLKEIKTYKLQQ
jgi:hypothetical protein